MIKEIYLYNQRKNKRLYPELVIIQTKFLSTSSNLSLEELADVLIDEVRVCYGRSYAGKVKIKPYAPPNLNKLIICEDISPLREVQRCKFEKYLPSAICVEWVEQEKTN